MSQAFERVQLTSAAAATAGSTRWDGGNVSFVVRGTWGGATAALQYSPDGGTNWVDIASTISTADNIVNCAVPQGHVQLRITGGSSPALTAHLIELPSTGRNAVTLSQTLNNTQSVGASGTAGEVDIYPTTASKGHTAITAADNTGNTVTTITTAAQATTRTYTVPDAGADASFVMTAGAQTIAGAKTFSTQPILKANTAVAAAGTNAGTAAALTTGFQVVTGADGTKGVILPTAADGLDVLVKNDEAANGILKVYPDTGHAINALAGDAALSMAAKSSARFICKTNVWYTFPAVPS